MSLAETIAYLERASENKDALRDAWMHICTEADAALPEDALEAFLDDADELFNVRDTPEQYTRTQQRAHALLLAVNGETEEAVGECVCSHCNQVFVGNTQTGLPKEILANWDAVDHVGDKCSAGDNKIGETLLNLAEKYRKQMDDAILSKAKMKKAIMAMFKDSQLTKGTVKVVPATRKALTCSGDVYGDLIAKEFKKMIKAADTAGIPRNDAAFVNLLKRAGGYGVTA